MDTSTLESTMPCHSHSAILSYVIVVVVIFGVVVVMLFGNEYGLDALEYC